MDYLSQHATTDKVAAKPVSSTGRSRWNRRRIGLTATAAAVVVGGVAAMGIAHAAVVPTPAHPYIVAPPGTSLSAGATTTIQVAGRTFGATSVPANATAATVNISSVNPSSSGAITVYTTGVRRPSTPSISFRRGEEASADVTVALNGSGELNVYSSARSRFTLRLLSYTTPGRTVGLPDCDSSTISTIAPSTRTLTTVGGSIRTGATDFGFVRLSAGTYDTRVIGGFTGFNNTDTWLPSTVFLTGTLVVVKGATIAADFSNDVTAGGVLIPKSNSATLTQDPTVAISTFLVLTAPTDVHVKLFAYASDSSSTGSGHVQANVQAAQFRKIC